MITSLDDIGKPFTPVATVYCVYIPPSTAPAFDPMAPRNTICVAYFTAPNVNPVTKYRWTIMPIITIGREMSTPPAAIDPQYTVYCVQSPMMATGAV